MEDIMFTMKVLTKIAQNFMPVVVFLVGVVIAGLIIESKQKGKQ